MQQVRRAALAPADPSSADRGVAARAAQLSQEAQIELRQERAAATEDDPSASDESASAATGAATDANAAVPDGTAPDTEADVAGQASTASTGSAGAGAVGALKSRARVAETGGGNPYASAIITGAALNSGMSAVVDVVA